MTGLHADWGAPDDYTSPAADLASAFEYYGERQQSATPVPGPVERPVALADLEAVTEYVVTYEGVTWKPGDGPGTELWLAVIARTRDGRWVAVEASTDYTGWGCQDFADIRVGATEDQVVRYGLSAEARRALGYEAVPS